MTPEDTRSQKPAREPQALSTEYHKARKQLMLWAGILFIWELVGIDLDRAKEAGNAGAIISAIKSPQAIPWVLVVLVGYFLFKTWIEWDQCNSLRRQRRASRFDYGSAWVVALLAALLYGYQSVKGIQVADTLQNSVKVRSVLVGLVTGVMLVWFAIGGFVYYKRLRELTARKLITLLAQLSVFVFLLLSGLKAGMIGFKYTVLAVPVGALTGIFMFLLIGRVQVGSRLAESKPTA